MYNWQERGKVGVFVLFFVLFFSYRLLNNWRHCVFYNSVSLLKVTLEFHQNDDTPVSLVEMRFHIPMTESAEVDPVEAFQQNVIKQASVLSVSGDAIAIFRELQCLTPR